MKEKDKWIKNFRTRMEGYSEPAPADLWEQLEKELDTQLFDRSGKHIALTEAGRL